MGSSMGLIQVKSHFNRAYPENTNFENFVHRNLNFIVLVTSTQLRKC